MTTKEQERKALAQVKRIIESLGEQSYLATAFDGCFQDAEENIDCDFAFSMKSRWESAEEKVEKLQKELAEAKELNGLLSKRTERAEAAAMDEELADQIYADYEMAIRIANDDLREASTKLIGMIGNMSETDEEQFQTVMQQIAALKRKIAKQEEIKIMISRFVK